MLVTALLTSSKKQQSSHSSHDADFVDLHTLVAEHGDVSHGGSEVLFTDGCHWTRPSSTRTAGSKAGNTADARRGPREPSREGSRDAGTSEKFVGDDDMLLAEYQQVLKDCVQVPRRVS